MSELRERPRAAAQAASAPAEVLDDEAQEGRIAALRDQLDASTRFWSTGTALLGVALAALHVVLHAVWLPGLVPLGLALFASAQHLIVSVACVQDATMLSQRPVPAFVYGFAALAVAPLAFCLTLRSAEHVMPVYLLNVAHAALAWYVGVAARESEADLAALGKLRYNLKSA